MAEPILPIFLGALQASLAVLLTILYGAILFLPALLITNVGNDDNNYLRLGGHNALEPPKGYEVVLSYGITNNFRKHFML